MEELLHEFVDSRAAALRVDRPRSVLHGVKLLGLESRNGRRYLPEALARAVGLYEGAKVNVNHPKGHPLAPRDYQERLGLVRGVELRPGEGLFAELHFNPKHPLAEQLLWDAEHAPQNVGLSHNVLARTARRGDQTVVEAIVQVQSVDLVADPASTRGLFEQSAPAWSELTLEQLAAARPDLLHALRAPLDEQLQALRAELAEHRAASAHHERRALVRRLLAEHSLPDPDRADPAARALVSPDWLGELHAAADESAVRALVRQRAELIRGAAAWQGGRPDRQPRSLEQRLVEPREPLPDAAAFARAVR